MTYAEQNWRKITKKLARAALGLRLRRVCKGAARKSWQTKNPFISARPLQGFVGVRGFYEKSKKTFVLVFMFPRFALNKKGNCAKERWGLKA